MLHACHGFQFCWGGDHAITDEICTGARGSRLTSFVGICRQQNNSITQDSGNICWRHSPECWLLCCYRLDVAFCVDYSPSVAVRVVGEHLPSVEPLLDRLPPDMASLAHQHCNIQQDYYTNSYCNSIIPIKYVRSHFQRARIGFNDAQVIHLTDQRQSTRFTCSLFVGAGFTSRYCPVQLFHENSHLSHETPMIIMIS